LRAKTYMKNKINNIVAWMVKTNDFFWSDEMVELICILNFKKVYY
jgi:hypothetical protein